MSYSEEEEFDEDFTHTINRRKTTKEDVLDGNFKRAEKSRKPKVEGKKPIKKKPFLKSGIVLLVVAIFCLWII